MWDSDVDEGGCGDGGGEVILSSTEGLNYVCVRICDSCMVCFVTWVLRLSIG